MGLTEEVETEIPRMDVCFGQMLVSPMSVCTAPPRPQQSNCGHKHSQSGFWLLNTLVQEVCVCGGTYSVVEQFEDEGSDYVSCNQVLGVDGSVKL